MAFTETLSPFFDADDFAESVVIDGVSVSAIFDNAWAQAGIGVAGAATADPVLTLPDASVPLEPEGKPVVVRGVAYRIVRVEPDGTGVSTLFLQRAA